MSVNTEITRIETAKADIKAAIEEKGVTVPDTTKIDGMAALISAIAGGTELPNGIAGIATGTLKLDKKPSSYITIQHNMGVKPNVLLMVVEEALPEVVPNLMTHYLQLEKARAAITSDGNTYINEYEYIKFYYKENGTHSALFGSSSQYTIADETEIYIIQSSAYDNMLPNYTYRWVCLCLDTIQDAG
jgi:hypothetical protein